MLKVKEVFYSLQGEGFNSGKPAIFVRFSGCNLWSGKPQHKEKSPCYFCDTDFNNGNSMNEDQLFDDILKLWPINNAHPFVIFTGGEPSMQLTNAFLNRLYSRFLEVDKKCLFAIETNGEINYKYLKKTWITLSPKTINFKIKVCNEIKLLWPLKSLHPNDLREVKTEYRYLQPIDDENYEQNLKSAIDFCLNNPEWSLSLQQHKIIGVR